MNLNIADRPLSLAGHLRMAATLLVSGSITYNWQSVQRCNCGLVARIITGKSENQLLAAMTPLMVFPSWGQNNWATIAARSCAITGVPDSEIFRQLYEAGMRFEDFSHLERQSNPEIVANIAKRYTQPQVVRRFLRPSKKIRVPAVAKHDHPGTLVPYLNLWAEMIEAHHATLHAMPSLANAQLEKLETRPLVKAE